MKKRALALAVVLTFGVSLYASPSLLRTNRRAIYYGHSRKFII